MKRFMVVDASSVIRKIMKRILEKEGVMMQEAEAADHMIELCGYEMPDCIILSNALTDMNVEDAIRQVRGMHDGKKPTIILSLIEMNVGRIMRAKRAGADGYMLKPFDRASLLEALAIPLSETPKGDIMGTDGQIIAA